MITFESSRATIFLTLTEGGTNIGDGDFLNIFFILFRMPPYGFSPITSTNIIISLQNFLTFTFDPFATLVWNFKAIPSTSPKLLSLNQDHPSKKVFFLVKSLQNSSYDNFSHRNAKVTKLWSHNHIYNIIWVTW